MKMGHWRVINKKKRGRGEEAIKVSTVRAMRVMPMTVCTCLLYIHDCTRSTGLATTAVLYVPSQQLNARATANTYYGCHPV